MVVVVGGMGRLLRDVELTNGLRNGVEGGPV